MPDFDVRLHDLAHGWLAEETGNLDAATVESDLAEVLARVGAGGVTPLESRLQPRRRPTWGARHWLVAASSLALVTGAVAVIAARAGDDDPAPVDTTVPTVSTPASTVPPTIAPSTTLPAGVPTTTPPPEAESPALGVARPRTVAQGDMVTIAPAIAVEGWCGIVTVLTVESSGLVEVGQLVDGTLVPVPHPNPVCESVALADPVSMIVPADFVVGDYVFCVDRRNEPQGCAAVTVVEAGGSSAPTETFAPSGTGADATGIGLDVPYVVRYSYDAGFQRFELHDIAPDGSDIGLDPSSVDDLYFPVAIGGGLRVGLSSNDAPRLDEGRCGNYWLRETGEPSASTASDLLAMLNDEIVMARSIGGNEHAVVMGRDVCPDGARWGDTGTYFELVRYDPEHVDAAPVQLARIDPDPAQVLFDDGHTIYATDELIVESVSADGRWVAVQQPYNSEDSRWLVYTGDVPGDPVALGSSCAAPGDVVGPPRFVGDDLVVVARECDATGGEIGDLVVEAVSLTSRDVEWSARVRTVAISSYSHTIANLSARVVDGELWVLVSSSAGVEQPLRAALLHGGDELEVTITTPDGVDPPIDYAFTASELIHLHDIVSP